MNRQAEHDIRRKTKVLEHAQQSGNVRHSCRKYSVSEILSTAGKDNWKKAVQRRWFIPNHAPRT